MATMPGTELVNGDRIQDRLTEICNRYEKTAPHVARWANDLYIRFRENADKVVLSEIMFAQHLFEDATWQHPSAAQNGLYKLLHRLGRSVEGMADY